MRGKARRDEEATWKRRERVCPAKVNAEGSDRESNKSSSRPAVKSDRDFTKKERGRGLEKDSVLATNSGT